MDKKKIVLLGGGHGLSAIIKSFINDNYDTSIIVTTTDNGGHTGLIRKEFDIPAIGDIRRCLTELIDNTLLEELLSYRFDTIHNVKNLSLGNLMLLSLIDTNLEDMLLDLKEKLNLKATLLPALNYSTNISAQYDDNTTIEGEEKIPSNKHIKRVFYNEKTTITDKVKNTLKEADYIVISPGSLYTSILPILAIKDIKRIIKRSKAKLIYISNIMTQNKETDDYSIIDMVKVIENELKRKIDTIISSSSILDNQKRERYSYELSFPTKESIDSRIIYSDLIDDDSIYIRHSHKKLSEIIRNII